MCYQEDINSQETEGQEPINYQALLFENQALKDEVESLRARLEETEELRRAISEGDLDALVLPGSKGKGDLVFTLDSADRAYRLLVETMNEGTATLAFDGTILYCNRRLAELLDIPSQAIVGTSIHQFIAPESEIAFKAFLNHRINAGEINLRTKDGRSLPVYLSISSTQGEDSPSTWCIVVTDLTEQKKNEEIVAAERLARSIIEQAAETIAVCDTSGRIIRFSNSMPKLFRCDPMFQRFEDIINLQFAEGEAKGESILPVSSALKGSTILGMEAIFESENHQKLNLLLNTGPLKNDDGEIIGCTVTLIDITERKQTEEELKESQATLKASIQSMTDAVYISDIEGNFIDFNDSFVTFHRFHSTEECYRKNLKYFLDIFEIYLIDGALVPVDMWPISRALRGETVTDAEFIVRRKDTGENWIASYNFAPIHDKDGVIIGSVVVARDITERKNIEVQLKETLDNLEEKINERTEELQKAYNSLKESENSLAEAQKIAHIGSWERDFVSNKYIWSDEMYRIFGLKPQESKIKYDTFLNYVHPDDRDYIVNVVKEAIKRKSTDINYRIILPNGEERTIHAKAKAVFDEKNNPVRIRGITQDITEQRKAKERIQNLANVVESSTEAIITKSFEGIITSWNKGAEQVYGYSAKEILGKSVSILEPLTLTGEMERLSEMIKRGEKVQQYETLRLRKDGKVINVSLTIFPVYDNQGKITAASIIATDISRRKEAEEKLRESEEKYRNIVETANEGISIIDAETKISYVNNKAGNLFGYNPEELIGKPIWDFISEDYKDIAKLNIKKRQLGVNEPLEIKLVRRDGSLIWVIINSKSIFNKTGKFIGSMNMLTDITERRKAEEALAKIEIVRKQEIHHRIKNNLQVISSLLDLQAEQFRDRKGIKDSEVLEAFKESQDRVTSMALIHEELYKGGEFDTLNFSQYIEELVNNLFLTYRLGNAAISLKLDLVENAFFDMDTAVPLGIIVNELVSNSFKHAFSGRSEGEIRISLAREEFTEFESKDCENSNFILSVSDNGVGIPENIEIEDLETLGMQLVTSLVDQLDGEFELKRNNGTEFSMRFTVKENNNSASIPAPELIE